METNAYNQGNKFNWADFFIGVLYIIAAIFFFTNPVPALGTLIIWFGVLGIIKGIFNFVSYSKIKKTTGARAGALIVSGVLSIIMGLILVFNLFTGVFFVGFIFAIWFISDSISHLVNADVLKLRSTFLYWFSIITNVICVILGFVLLFNPASSALTVPFIIAFYFLIFGIERIVSAF